MQSCTYESMIYEKSFDIYIDYNYTTDKLLDGKRIYRSTLYSIYSWICH